MAKFFPFDMPAYFSNSKMASFPISIFAIIGEVTFAVSSTYCQNREKGHILRSRGKKDLLFSPLCKMFTISLSLFSFSKGLSKSSFPVFS